MTILVIALLLFLFQLNLAIRGGLGTPATFVVEFLDVWSGYLWPVWYLLGTGLIFKLLSHTKVLTQTLKHLLPGRWVVLVVSFLLVLATVIGWSEFVIDTPALPWSQPLIALMIGVYRLTHAPIWSEPLYAFTLGIMKWVFLIDLVIVVWLAVRRRLTGGIILAIIGHTILLWFVVNQYYFKYLGFLDPGSGSPLVTALLALMVMWILYRAGLGRTLESSPLWPAIGRLAVYSAILLFVILEIHTRSALHDTQTMNRVFMYTFRGIIDFGLAYMLCIYASRSLKELPVAVSRLIGAFGLGATAALVFNGLDKLVAAGFSLAATKADLMTRVDLILQGEMARLAQLVPALPQWWLVVRGTLAVAVLVAIGAAVGRRVRDVEAGPAKTIFLLVAAGCGMAAFAQIRLDIPIVPNTWVQLITPYRWSLEVDAHIVALFFSYTLPALLLALAVTHPRWPAAARWTAGVAGAAVVQVVAMLLWPGREPWLRSSGMMWTLGVAALGLFLVLVRAARIRVEKTMPGEREEPVAGAKPYLGSRGVAILAALAAVVLAAVASMQVRTGRPIPRNIDGIPAALRVPAAWQPLPAAPPEVNATYTRSTLSFGRPLLVVDLREGTRGNLDKLLETLVEEGAASFNDFEVAGGYELWDRVLPGARAFEFFCSMPHPSGEAGPMIGLAALLPVSGDDVVVVILVCEIGDFETRRWDVIFLARSLRGR